MNKFKSIRNFWSLNQDEVVASSLLRDNLKDVEVYMPLNSQMKDIDLALISSKNKKTITIQVKGSKTFKPEKKDINEYGEGSGVWIQVKKETIKNSVADYFIFQLYAIEQFDIQNGRLYVEPHIIIIPTKELINKLDKYKNSSKSGLYHFYFWVNPKKAEVFDYRDLKNKGKGNREHYDQFLNEKGLEKLNEHFK